MRGGHRDFFGVLVCVFKAVAVVSVVLALVMYPSSVCLPFAMAVRGGILGACHKLH